MIRPLDVHRFRHPAGVLAGGADRALAGRFDGSGAGRRMSVVVTMNETPRLPGGAAGEHPSAPASRMKAGAARPRPEAGRRECRP